MGWWYWSILHAPVARVVAQGHVGSGRPPEGVWPKRTKVTEPPEARGAPKRPTGRMREKRSRDLGRPVGQTPNGKRRIKPTNQNRTPPTKWQRRDGKEKKKNISWWEDPSIPQSQPGKDSWRIRTGGDDGVPPRPSPALHRLPFLAGASLHAGTTIPNWQWHHTGRRDQEKILGRGTGVARAGEGRGPLRSR